MPRRLEYLAEFRRDFGQRMTEGGAFRPRDQAFGRAVEDGDAAVGVDADHARARAGEHGLGESPAAVDHVARMYDVVVLRAQLLRHLVEGFAELGEVALGAADRHAHTQIAGGDDVGGADQAADRSHEPIGEIEPDPRRGQKNDERDDGEHQRKRDLNTQPAGFEIGVFADTFLRLAQLLNHARIEHARHIEIHVVVTVQFDGGGDVIAFGDECHLRLGLGDLAEQCCRRQHDGLVHGDTGALNGRAVGADDQGGGEAAGGGLRGKKLLEPLAIGIEHRLGAAEIEGHGHDLAPDRLGVLAHISVGDD